MVEGECNIWTGSISSNGYGIGRLGGRLRLAHRWAYEQAKGPIPDGLVIDHLCRNKACVNPNHLEAVTNRENVMRGEGPSLARERRLAITHCKKGHEFTPANTRETARQRVCRECRRLIQIEYRRKNHDSRA